jgi:lysozyme family protein
MAPGCDLMVFNDGMVCGVGHVSRLVQRIVGVPVDGVIGPVTLRGIKSMGAGRFINAMAKADDEYYASLAKAPLFLRGWTRREAEARALALKMAGIPDARS